MTTTELRARKCAEKIVNRHAEASQDRIGATALILGALTEATEKHRADTERLDWLDRKRYLVDFNNEGTAQNGSGLWQCTDGDHWGEGSDVRSAIDAAMSKERQP